MAQARRLAGRPRRADLDVPTGVAITTAASMLFMANGYRAVTMDMVAEAAKVTKPTVYYHFGDKASLLVAVATTVFEQARRATEGILQRPESLRSRLQTIAAIVLSLPQSFTNFDTVMHEASLDLRAEQLAAIRAAEQGLNAVVEQAVLRAAATGEIQTEDPVLVAHGFIALLRVGQTRDGAGTPRFPDVERTARVLLSALWDGIGGRRD